MLKKLLATVSLIAIGVTVNPIKALAVNSDKSISWTKTTKESESNNYYDVTSIAPRTTENLNAVATNGQQFVAVGSNGIIMQSNDGK